MIECPICHVHNEDRSLFCAECGQRFPTPEPQPIDPNNALLKPPTQDAIPRRPTAKLSSPLLEGDANRQSVPEGSFGFQKSNKNPIDSMVSGRPRDLAQAPSSPETNSSAPSSAPSNDRGEAVNNSGRRGLHSPLLDRGGLGDEFGPAPGVQSAFPHRQSEIPANPIADAKPVRPNRVLRSPLLQGEIIEDEIPPGPQSAYPGPAPGQSPSQPGRLHSPVLDPFGQTDRFEPDNYFDAEEIDDPNVLRSPLLAARSKLPVSDKPPLALPKVTPDPKIEAKEPASPPPPAPQVKPPNSQTNLVKPLGATPVPQAFPQTAPPPLPFAGLERKDLEPASNSGGFEDISKAPVLKTPTTPAGAFRKEAPLPTGPKGLSSPPESVLERSDETLDRRETAFTRQVKSQPPSRPVLFDRAIEENDRPPSTRQRRLSTPVVVVLLSVLVTAKAFYLHSLGPISANYVPFFIDQLGQLLVIIWLIICA